ncbi:MAG: hypothetical protein JOZ39_06165, partial [Chloroflexi bacterium]|nr:hypothetical protein [Chloroflexota bacterium]
MEPRVERRSPLSRFVVFGLLALGLVAFFGVVSHLTHTATIPNVGLPASNSKSLPGLSAYDPQVSTLKEYLGDLIRLDYAAAYQVLAPSTRAALNPQRFEADRRAEGALGQPAVWADDQNSARAEYVLGRADGSSDLRRHRFLLKQENGRWWIDREVPIDTTPPPATSLSTAMTAYVQQRAGRVWTNSIELLRQEGFEGGQLLLFSYIEPHPQGSLAAQRVADLA